MTHETEAPGDPAMATAEPPVTAQRQRLTTPSRQPAAKAQPSAPAEPAAATTPSGAQAGGAQAGGAQAGGGRAGGEPPRNESIVTELMSQGKDEVDALIEAVGYRKGLSGEAQDLARLIQRRLAEVAAAEYARPHAPALDHLEIQRAFLMHRFVGPMRTYERSFRGYSVLDNFLNLTSILAGVGASLAAALDWSKVYTIVLGLIVGALQSLSQWLKPSRRSTRRGLAAAAMRSEAWAFLQGRDRYKGKDLDTAWALFCDQINHIEGREQIEQDREAVEVGRTQPVRRG